MASCSGPGNKHNSGDTVRPDNSQASEVSAKRKFRLLNLEELVRKRASTKHWPVWQTTWDLTLNEILDEEDVLQECKAQNMKLIDFLILPSNIEELVNYITQEPSDDTDEKLRYKYPNTACELLISDVTQITAKLAGDDALMAKIYSFLENEAPLNPLLASFFSKVMGLLITRKSERMLEFLKSKDDFISHLLHHLGTSAIMDLLLRLITCIEAPKYHMMCLNWLSEQQLIQKLVAMIDPSQPEEKHCNACQSLCDIIRLSREQMSQLQDRAEPDPLLATIESEETITELLNHMFDGEKVESVLVSGIAVIQNLLEYKRLTPDGGTEAITSLDAQRLSHGICNTVNAVIPRLKDFHQLLQDPPKQYYSPMVTTVGTLNPPFGNTRLQTARLIASLLFTRTHRINAELANLGTLGVLLDLCFEYMWNNFLHTQVEQSIAAVLNDEPSEEEGEDHKDNPLLSQLFVKHKLIEKILDVWEENDQHQSRPGGHRKGYMGHLTKIANHVVDSMEKGSNSEKVKGYFEALPENIKERWNQFVSGPLAEINKQNTVVLVSTSAGQNLYSSSEEDDPDFKDITFPQDNAMDQAFADYQLQQMTSNFIDQFGFNEEDFAESEEWIGEKFKEQICSINFDINTDEITNTRTLFDHMCNEKIHQFDDQDSEEDLWEDKEITFSQSSGSRQNSTSGGASGQPAVPPAATTDSDREQSDSSDSEEELDSPRQIHQSPSSSAPQCIIADSTTTEKMDVDNTEGWANFDDISMETSPALAVTDPGPVVWQSEQNMSSAVTSDNWAKFNSESNDSVIKVPSDKSDTSLADFTNLNASGNESSEAQGRSRSPVAMDTNELSSNTSSRVAAYLVSSAPADLASTINEATEASNAQNKEQKQEKLSGENVGSEQTSSNTLTSSDISSTQTASCDVPTQPDSYSLEQTVTEETKNVLFPAQVVSPPGATSEDSTMTPDHIIISSDMSCDKTVTEKSKTLEEEELNSTPTICDKVLESANTEMDNTKENISSTKDPATAFDDGNDKDDDELIDNFNFLASGLMKCSDEPDTSKPTSKAQDASPPLPDSTATDQSDLEKARAQAKEALEQFEAATSTSPSQNGPV